MYTEVQLDTLVGPTHHFAGLSLGNIASMENKGIISSPKKAALQGLEKMNVVMELGIPQAFFPPQKRPDLSFLKRVGFETVASAYDKCPELLLAAFSSSFMWTANVATSTPSLDTLDSKHHITPANLGSNLHRHLEVLDTTRMFQQLMANPDYFVLHAALPSVRQLFDEGAANHTRLSPTADTQGLHLFVYGDQTQHFAPRQAKLASESIARLHQLPKERVLILEQNPEVIDEGVFHNDVISVGHLNLFLAHEKTFKNKGAFDLIASTYHDLYQQHPLLHIVSEKDLPLQKAIKTYFFNSQILSLPFGRRALLAPQECSEDAEVKSYIEKLPYFSQVRYISLNESMKNGGGPACLRLRLLLNNLEQKMIPNCFWMDPTRSRLIGDLIEKYYPDTLSIDQLKDKSFLEQIAHTYIMLEQLFEKLR